MYQARCRKHSRLMGAIVREVSELSSGAAAAAARRDGRNDGNNRRLNSSNSSSRGLKTQVMYIDELMMIETKIDLWQRLEKVIIRVCSLGGGD